jgi:hypothetical protein
MPTPIHLPDIPDAERTALVEQLVVLIEALAEDNCSDLQTSVVGPANITVFSPD